MEGYMTIAAPAQGEFEERRSRFIGQSAPVTTPEEANQFVATIRAQHREATHNCYAYALRGGACRFSDDGEPSGTAGRPMLEVIQREGVVDVVVVVTRYFGGTLLGAGGLVRAYAQGAKTALDAAQRVEMRPALVVALEADYHQYGKITHLLPRHGVRTLDTQFGAGVELTLLLPQERLAGLTKEVEELSAGTVTPLILEEKMAHFSPEERSIP